MLRTSKVRMSLWNTGLLILCKRHATSIINEAMMNTLIHRSVVGSYLDFVESIFTRAHKVLRLLTISKSEEVGLSVKPTVRHWLITFLTR